jgi:hypothetical protein
MVGTPSGTQTAWSSSVAVTYLGTANENTNTAAKNFGNFSAASNGVMVVFFAMRQPSSSRTVTTVSIGGSNGTIWTTNANGISNWAGVYRGVSSGANNVTVNMSGTPGSAAPSTVQVYLITGYNNPDPIWSDSLPANGGTSAGGTSSNLVYALNRGSVNVFCNFHEFAEGTGWSSATEDADTTNVVTWAAAHKSGSATILDTETTTETVSWTTSVTYILMGAGWV